MPKLDDIAESGILGRTRAGVNREFVPFSEELTIQCLVEQINAGAVSIHDAYQNFWSYKEDASVWGLSKNTEWRALLPDWREMLLEIRARLTPDKAKEFENVILTSFRKSRNVFDTDYSPFMHDAEFSSNPEELKMGDYDYFHPFPGDPLSKPASYDEEYSPEPPLEDLMILRHHDELVGTIMCDDNPQYVRESALKALCMLNDPAAYKSLAESFPHLKNKNITVELKTQTLCVLAKSNQISPKEFAEEFMSFLPKLLKDLLKEQRYGPQYSQYSGISYEFSDSRFDDDAFWKLLPQLPEQHVAELGRLIRNNYGRLSSTQKIGSIRILASAKDKNSAQFLLRQTNYRKKIIMPTGYHTGYETSLAEESLDAIAVLNYAQIAPALHQRLIMILNEYFSPRTTALKKKYDQEKEQFHNDERDEYGTDFDGEPVTPTLQNLNNLTGEINMLFRTLGHIGYAPIVSQIKQMIAKKNHPLIDQIILDALGIINTEESFDILLKLHDDYVNDDSGGFLGTGQIYEWTTPLEQLVNTPDRLKKLVRLSRRKETYGILSEFIQTIHEKLRPKGYTACQN